MAPAFGWLSSSGVQGRALVHFEGDSVLMKRFESGGFDGDVVSARRERGDSVKSLLVRYGPRGCAILAPLDVNRRARDGKAEGVADESRKFGGLGTEPE